MSGPIKLQKGYSLQRAQVNKGQGIPQNYDKKLRDVAKLYETQFLRQMHKAMKGTVQKSGFIKEGMAEKIFQEKLDHKHIDQWGDKGGMEGGRDGGRGMILFAEHVFSGCRVIVK